MTPSADTMTPSAATMTPSAATMTTSAATMTPSADTVTASAGTMTPSFATVTPSFATVTPSAAIMTPTVETTMTPTVVNTMITVTTTSALPTPQQPVLVPAVVTVGVLVIVLMAVVVIITAVVIMRRKSKTATMECHHYTEYDGEHRSQNEPELLTQEPSIEMKKLYPEELPCHQPSSQTPISINPQPLAGSEVALSSQHVYAQPDECKKQTQQQLIAEDTYSKLATCFPHPSTSINSDPGYSRLNLHAILSTHIAATTKPACDEEPATLKLEHRDKQPASLTNTTEYYNVAASDAVPNNSHQFTLHPFSRDTPVPYVNFQLVTYDEPRRSMTRRESFNNNTRNLALFDDPSYATPFPLPHSSDNGNKTRQFQFSGHHEVDSHFKKQ